MHACHVFFIHFQMVHHIINNFNLFTNVIENCVFKLRTIGTYVILNNALYYNTIRIKHIRHNITFEIFYM